MIGQYTMIEMLKSMKYCINCMLGRFLVVGFIIFLVIDLITR